METVVFKHPEVQEQLARFVRAKLHNDHETRPDLNAKHLKLQEERFKSGSLPFYVVLTPDDKPVATESYLADPKAFAAFLKAAFEKAIPQAAALPLGEGLAGR